MTDLSARQTEILNLVDQQGFVATEQLGAYFNVTPQTIRRDINILCESNLLQRFHGGAGRRTSSENEPYTDRKSHFQDGKRRIADRVAKSIPNGASLFLNIGTTTEAVAEALLHHSELRIITNNLNVASVLKDNGTFEIMLAGGRVRKSDGGVVGPATTDFVSQFRLDFGIIGVSGIDEEGGLLDYDYDETRTAKAIMANSRKVFLVADHTKFGRPAMTRFGDLSYIDTIFTDEAPTSPYDVMLQHKEVNVVLPD